MLVDHLGARLHGAALRLRPLVRGLITSALLALAYVLWGLADVIVAVGEGSAGLAKTVDGWATRIEAAAQGRRS